LAGTSTTASPWASSRRASGLPIPLAPSTPTGDAATAGAHRTASAGSRCRWCRTGRGPAPDPARRPPRSSPTSGVGPHPRSLGSPGTSSLEPRSARTGKATSSRAIPTLLPRRTTVPGEAAGQMRATPTQVGSRTNRASRRTPRQQPGPGRCRRRSQQVAAERAQPGNGGGIVPTPVGVNEAPTVWLGSS
jgi:hypothetical protein